MQRERKLKRCDGQYITEGFLLVISEMIANCLVSITRVINNSLIGNVKS